MFIGMRAIVKCRDVATFVVVFVVFVAVVAIVCLVVVIVLVLSPFSLFSKLGMMRISVGFRTRHFIGMAGWEQKGLFK